MKSALSLRLVLAMVGLTAAVLVVTFFGLRQTVKNDLTQRLDSGLENTWADMKTTALDPAQDLTQIKSGMRSFIDQQNGINNRAFVFKTSDGELIASNQELKPLVGKDKDGFSTVDLGRLGTYRIFTKQLKRRDQVVATCVIAASLSVVTDSLEGFDQAFLTVALITLLLAAAISFLIARKITKPVHDLTRTLGSSELAGIPKPLKNESNIKEFDVLTNSFNAMVARVRKGFARERAFVSDASHELRTPLAVLRGQVELLLHKPDMDRAEREHTVELLIREIDLMSNLVEDMLVLARLDGDGELRIEPIDIDEFTRDLERDLPLVGERNYTVELRTAGTFYFDYERINRVLRNLVANAVAHTGENGKITVTLTEQQADLHITVTDDGVGIPEDQLEAIFGRFHRVTEQASGDSSGSGLGLSIVRSIVESHQGSVWAENSPNGGAVFHVVLPRDLNAGLQQRAS